MVEAIPRILGLIVILAVIPLGIWALRRQGRQYPKGTQIATDEERKQEPGRWTGWTRGGPGDGMI
jgi:hypothetical protein